jgi:hypothetical protein
MPRVAWSSSAATRRTPTSGFAGTIYLVQVCKEHDPDPPAVDAATEAAHVNADR